MIYVCVCNMNNGKSRHKTQTLLCEIQQISRSFHNEASYNTQFTSIGTIYSLKHLLSVTLKEDWKNDFEKWYAENHKGNFSKYQKLA